MLILKSKLKTTGDILQKVQAFFIFQCSYFYLQPTPKSNFIFQFFVLHKATYAAFCLYKKNKPDLFCVYMKCTILQGKLTN